ncbi:MAG: family 16 glycosylhydrolase [Bacteroidales bacterium]|nr:family 16 glycosylhydrolase [Bacteroidales bacterium]
MKPNRNINHKTSDNSPTGLSVFSAGIILGLFLIFSGCDKKDDHMDFTPNFNYSFVDDNHVQFTNESNGEYYSMIWNFGNGVIDSTIEKRKTYIVYYPQSGNFTASLRLTNYYGDNKTESRSINITTTDLVISFSAVIDQDHPNYVHLTNTSQGTYDSFKWIYRSMVVENETEHTAYFPYAGDYEVELSVNVNNTDYLHLESVVIEQDDPNIVTNLIWSEEFEYTGLPESSKWTIETGTGVNGWGNQELQYYTSSQNNLMVDDGILTITALEESFQGMDYTSGRIKTENKFDFQYGRIEARIKMPYGQGMWAAFWMLGANNSTVGWPECGEIDIAEMVGGTNNDNTCHSTLHWDNAGENAQYGQSYSLNSGILADNFHVYAVEWNEQKITAYIDDIQYFEADITPGDLSEFHNNFFIILNLAVGGTWPGNPDASTVFPQSMQVDYIRVYQLEK